MLTKKTMTKSIIAGLLAGLPVTPLAQATAPEDMAYWFSMRGISEDVNPSFVSASYVQTATYTAAYLGCRNKTYYLTSAGYASVQAARAQGETVQIHRGEPGSSSQQSTVICLLQADQ